MQKFNFLTAKWEYLAMFNYEVDAAILLPYLPPYTTLDLYNGKAIVSVVGFLFNNTKVLGISWPMHKNFEEVNLRFYVKRTEGNIVKRGVAFVSEIVPKRIIATMANTLYNEHYTVAKMSHSLQVNDQHIEVTYKWQLKNKQQNSMYVKAENILQNLVPQSEAEFILEHYYGYNTYSNTTTIAYTLQHPSWQIYKVIDAQLHCNIEQLYGNSFAKCIQNVTPTSVLLAKGSEVSVQFPKRIVAG